MYIWKIKNFFGLCSYYIYKVKIKYHGHYYCFTDFEGDVSNLNKTAKSQIISYFYDDNGKRNKKSIAYFVISKNKEIN